MKVQRRNWKEEIFYQIYPASFKDSNNDGYGDLKGIIQKIPYLKKLGISTVWLSPIYQSPMVDNGYDISDYYQIDPRFGSMDDFDELITKFHQNDLKLIMDLVVNHTSDQHPWFKQALLNSQSKYRNYYIFKEGSKTGAPNNWRSNFGKGSSWTKIPGENKYYHHVFSEHQPDLNWENPELRTEIYKMINWWLGKGVDGFRIDAITFIKKDQDFKSITPDGSDGLAKVKKKAENRPGIEKFLAEMKTQTFDKYDAITVGETSGIRYSQLDDFIGQNGFFSMAFDFKYADIDVESGSEWYKRTNWQPNELQKLITKSQNEIQKYGWAANFFENHDQPRSVSKYIKNKCYQNEIGAKALGILFFNLRGCPFIYQGQELGMKNAFRSKIDDFNDISSINNYHRAIEEGFTDEEALNFVNQRSRDNARLPFLWNSNTQTNYGFNEGHQPWIFCGQIDSKQNVKQEEQDENSTLNFYRKMIRLRQNDRYHDDLVNGMYKELDLDNKNVIAYQRGLKIKVIVNLSDCEQIISGIKIKNIILNNYSKKPNLKNEKIELKPYQAIMIGG